MLFQNDKSLNTGTKCYTRGGHTLDSLLWKKPSKNGNIYWVIFNWDHSTGTYYLTHNMDEWITLFGKVRQGQKYIKMGFTSLFNFK